MIGIDTCFLVDLDVASSPRHKGAVKLFEKWMATKKEICIFYNVFLEYQHIVTDQHRFENPLSMEQAIERTWFWSEQERIKVIYPDDDSYKRAQIWLNQHHLGRKRLIDTHMAACYAENGVDIIWTANPHDFEVFEVFDVVDYTENCSNPSC
ncbi:MAG: type II toxin-antitoxin system VapC family toxin [Treponema sp.]|nr:type II toxin-antitoxin system VapC family toxin [Treponema sp.]